jgi:hypothetical protein
MTCIYREGKMICSWWSLNQCLNPNVSGPVKNTCKGRLPKYKTEGIKQQNLEEEVKVK